MGFFNYTIKCTIRYNYQCSEGATVHNRHVIYCSHCLYCSAPLPNDYGKLSHLHGCHGNGGADGDIRDGEPLISPHPISAGWDTMGAAMPPRLGMLWGGGCWWGAMGMLRMGSGEDPETASKWELHLLES